MQSSEVPRLAVSGDVHIEDFDDELVALHLVTEEVFVLNGSAAVFVRAIQEHQDRQAALEAAASVFGRPTDELETDFAALIGDLIDRQILVA